MLATVTPMLNTFLQTIGRAVEEGGITAETLQRYYGNMALALRHFKVKTEGEAKPKLPLIIRQEVLRMTRHLIDMQERLPRGSTTLAVPLGGRFIMTVMKDECMTVQLAELIVEHQEAAGVELSQKDLQRCFLCAMDEGAYEKAGRFYQMRVDPAGATTSERSTLEDIQAAEDELGPSTLSGFATTPGNTDQICDLFIVSRTQSFPDFIRSVRPYLSPVSLDGSEITLDQILTSRFAWSLLITKAGRREQATANQIVEFYDHMPDYALCAHTIAPTIQALLHFGDVETAWKVWQDAVEHQTASKEQGRYIDQVVLGIATDTCATLQGPDAAIAFLDKHAVCTNHKGNDKAEIGGPRYRLKASNINVLLRQCSVGKRPSVAMRLWKGAHARYGVRLDEWSLGMLLETARTCEFASVKDEEVDTDDLSSLFRTLMKEFRFRRYVDRSHDGDTSEQYSEDQLTAIAEGSHTVFLDPPGFKWYHDPGPRPWKRAREIFRGVVLTNWPFLRDVTSPLELQSGPFGFTSVFGGSIRSTKTPEHSTTLPLSAQYAHFIPDKRTWHAFIRLLGTFNCVEEIPLALAWMKELGIEPRRKTLLDALMFVAEVEGPRRRVKGVGADEETLLITDEQLLRIWLEEWLGTGEVWHRGEMKSVVPAEAEVVEMRTMIMGKGQQLIL